MADILIPSFRNNWSEIFIEQFLNYFEEVKAAGGERHMTHRMSHGDKKTCFNFVLPISVPEKIHGWTTCTVEDIAKANEAYSGMPVEATTGALERFTDGWFYHYDGAFWAFTDPVLILITHE